jgi:hypothetical protein
MLGRHADAFFRKQARERVLAGMPNGSAASIAYPDREPAGTGKVVTTRGQYETPGPQNVVDANNMLPGMGETASFAPGVQPVPQIGQKDMLPGMGQYADMLPGMGNADMLPGMGDFDLKKLAVPGLLIGAAVVFLMRQKRRA